MSTATATCKLPRSAGHLWFETHLPELTRRCRTWARRLPRDEGEEATAEVLAQAFRCVLSAEARGKLHRLTTGSLIRFFGRAYRVGRRMTGCRSTDVLSEAGRLRHRRRVMSLSDANGTEIARCPAYLRLSDVLADPRADCPLENVRRNIDYLEILEREGANRKVKRVFTFLCETASAGRQVDLARELGVSPARVCQIKGELAGMLAAHGYQPPATCKTVESPKKRGRPAGKSWGRRREIPLNAGTSPAADRRGSKSENRRRDSRQSAA